MRKDTILPEMEQDCKGTTLKSSSFKMQNVFGSIMVTWGGRAIGHVVACTERSTDVYINIKMT